MSDIKLELEDLEYALIHSRDYTQTEQVEWLESLDEQARFEVIDAIRALESSVLGFRIMTNATGIDEYIDDELVQNWDAGHYCMLGDEITDEAWEMFWDTYRSKEKMTEHFVSEVNSYINGGKP